MPFPISADNRLLCAFVALFSLSGCSPLAFYNGIIPFDGQSALAARDVAYGDHPRQVFDVYVPTAAGAGPHPVIVFFYGGSWRSGDKDRYAFVGRALAAQGAVAVIADYRLVPDVRYPGFIEDNAAAVAKAREIASRFGGDPDRLVLSGHSAGAYNAALLALDPRHLDAAGVPRKAIAGLIGLSGPYKFEPREYRVTRAAFEGSYDDPAIQPLDLARAGAGAPPALLMHGADDTTVEPRNAGALAEALREAGVRADSVLFDGIGHAGALLALSKPLRGSAPVLPRIDAFLKSLE